MIQRIQTLYLFVAVILTSISLFGGTLIDFFSNQKLIEINLFEIHGGKTPKTLMFYIPVILLITLLCVAISCFKNLKLQKRLSWLALLISVLWNVFMFAFSIYEAKSCSNCELTHPLPTLIFYVQLSSIIFIYLAIRGINKDKNLLDSLNRLR